jgi:hypothetical protein
MHARLGWESKRTKVQGEREEEEDIKVKKREKREQVIEEEATKRQEEEEEAIVLSTSNIVFGGKLVSLKRQSVIALLWELNVQAGHKLMGVWCLKAWLGLAWLCFVCMG